MSVVTKSAIKAKFQTGDFPTEQDFIDFIDSVYPYEKYVALLTQTGTNAPVATVLENTLGGTIVWSYVGAGDYNGTLTNAFTVNKSFSPGMNQYLVTPTVRAVAVSFLTASTVKVYTTSGNDILSNLCIEIRVYP